MPKYLRKVARKNKSTEKRGVKHQVEHASSSRWHFFNQFSLANRTRQVQTSSTTTVSKGTRYFREYPK